MRNRPHSISAGSSCKPRSGRGRSSPVPVRAPGSGVRAQSRWLSYFGYVTERTATRPAEVPDRLLAHGRHWVTTREIADDIGGSLVDARQAASRWQAKGLAFSPTRGAYVVIPPQFRTWRAVPASHFIDDMMRFLGHDYYVGFLTAAEVHDAGHQRPQAFQVVTNRRLRSRTFGRVRIEFILNARTAERPTAVINTPTGTMRVSTTEATVFDLVSAPEHSGGLSNVATVIGDLLEDSQLEPGRLAAIADLWPTAVAQRTGWIIQHMAGAVGVDLELDQLAAIASRGGRVRLVPSGGDGPLDSRWKVVVNAQAEPDR